MRQSATSDSTTPYMSTSAIEARDAFIETLNGIIKPADLRKFRIPHATTPEFYSKYMASLGGQFFLNTISAGQLPAEVALEINVPVLFLKSWLAENVPAEELNAARKSCAESLVVKSKTILLLPLEDNVAAGLAKEYSKRMLWIAERMDADVWGPPLKEENDRPSTFSITINSAGDTRVQDAQEAMREAEAVHGRMTVDEMIKIEYGGEGAA